MKHSINEAIFLAVQEGANCLRRGGIIAYPTEAVYGLGCDPANIHAVSHLLTLKKRSLKKGFILIASSFSQVQDLVEPISPKSLARVFASWPGPLTWVFPAHREVPFWIRGDHKTVAIRVTAHPIAHLLCELFGGPVISTSANVENAPPIRDKEMLKMTFGQQIDAILPGELGASLSPTQIRDAITGEIIRP